MNAPSRDTLESGINIPKYGNSSTVDLTHRHDEPPVCLIPTFVGAPTCRDLGLLGSYVFFAFSFFFFFFLQVLFPLWCARSGACRSV